MIGTCKESVRRGLRRFGVMLCAAALFAGIVGGAVHEGRASKTDLMPVKEAAAKKDPTLVLTQGMAEIVEVSGPVSDIMVANPSIVDVMVLQANRLYMVGAALGTTNIIAVDAQGNVVKRMNVRVKIDDTAIQDMVDSLFPEEKVKVIAMGEQVVLSGQVSNPGVSNRLVNVVSRFVAQAQGSGTADIDSSIVNMLTVSGEQQVMLRVKVIEASRQVLRELGISTSYTEPETLPGQPGALRHLGGTLTSTIAGGLSATPMGQGTLVFDNLGTQFGPLSVAIEALEQDGLINTLAEPNMTAVSGEQAGFLAGGEIPVPGSLDQNGNAVIEYRPFGVGLNFRPLVLSSDRISLQLSTEVSAVSSILNNLPTFSVRRAQTTVELGSGGSLMIAGLLRSDSLKSMDDIPGIKKIPIISSLMSSETFRRNESELVVIVTAYLVTPYSDKTHAEKKPSTERQPLAAAFETNIRRTYNRRPLEEGLFTGETAYGYLID